MVKHGIVGAVLMLAGGLLAPAAATAAPATGAHGPDVPTGTIVWGECDNPGLAARGAECGTLAVPLDYAKPKGTKITLALSRIPHSVPAADYQGVMLTNPGGPGGSGLTLSVLGEYVPKDAGAAYDWIGFDPRGVGASEPAVSCDPEYLGYDRPRYVPTSAAIAKTWKAKAAGYSADCAANNGPILEHLTTRDSALDMESIRKALGAGQLNYYGFSYGTYLGQVYSTLFPSRVRRMVFDGTVNPDNVWYQANLEQDAAFDRNMNIWFGWLAKHDDTYHLGDSGAKVRRLFYATQEKLYRNPVQASGGKLGGSEWNDAFLYAGYYQIVWLDLADVFASYVNDGNVDALEAAYLDASGFGDDNGYAVYNGVQCTDTPWPTSWFRWAFDNWRTYAKAPYVTWGNAWYNYPCVTWPATADRPVRIDGRKTASLLMINETLDAATPYSGSLRVRQLYPKASLIAEPGGTTHSGSLYGNACVDDQIADYLLDGTLPPRVKGNRADATCEPLPEPEPEPAVSARLAPQATPAPGITRRDLTLGAPVR